MMNQNLEKKNHYNILYSYYQDLLTEKQKEVFQAKEKEKKCLPFPISMI